MQSVSFLDNQQIVVTAQPEDSAGDPSTNFNPALWAVVDPTVVAATNISADGLTATLVAKGVGSTTVTVTGLTGNGGTNYSSTFAVTINPNVPTQFVFVFGTPTAQ